MDLRQKKLVKEEWEALELPIGEKEKNILNLIKNGYDNINIRYNLTKSLLEFMKISGPSVIFHGHFYRKYFEPIFKKYIKKYNCPVLKIKINKKVDIKKADKIRINNSETKMNKEQIYEYILLHFLEKFLKHKKKALYYYTLIHLLKNHIINTNIHVIEYIKFVLNQTNLDKGYFIKNAQKIIELNNNLIKYSDISLYTHQKELFNHCKHPQPKLILYQAPTGMGKTISPIGLGKEHKLIFVCAAKHVGLQLARACISMEYPIAIAFGCTDPGDIRLHYYAVKDYVKNRRTGGIFRVDNTVGDKVQIIISDIQSYLPAMRYMLAFNNEEKIIWYWDEPTITLDCDTHEYHDILCKNWRENEIPNVVLSSATLPNENEIMPCIQFFRRKFMNTQIFSITNYECTKTIPILDKNGFIVLPHLIYSDYNQIKNVVKHIKKRKTLLRHFDVKEISKFLMYVNNYLPERFKINNYFENIYDIDTPSIKLYYLECLLRIKNEYSKIFTYFQENRKSKLESIKYITTKDAHTLTDGPTLFLAKDVEKISNFCIKTSKIPEQIMKNLIKKIGDNDKIKDKIASIERQIKNVHIEVDIDKRREKKNPKVEKQEAMIQGLYRKLTPIKLDSVYVPNSYNHLKKWVDTKIDNAFTSNLSEEMMEKITMLNIESTWKILLMMGIGVFKTHKCVEYMEIMKKMATEQRLYMIIASTDYIYGTNYQFCHGYLANDLNNLTQDKMLQAFGRVGRTNAKQTYSLRLRDQSMIDLLFKDIKNKPEVRNMNKLFG